VALTPDGKLALTGSDDRTTRLWDVRTGKELNLFRDFGAVRAIALSADGKYVASAYNNSLLCWEVQSRNQTGSVSFGGVTSVNGLAFLADNQRFLTAKEAQDLTIVTAEPPTRLTNLPRTDRSEVRCMAVSADGRLAILGCARGAVQIYNIEAKREERALPGHKEDVLGVALTKDGRVAVTASADKTVAVWDALTGKALRVLRGHLGRVTSLAMTPDGRRAVSGSDDKTVRVWDPRTGKEVRRLNGHTDAITSVAISADGRLVLSASADKTVRLWDLAR
jgi:WD40 repeat protein